MLILIDGNEIKLDTITKISRTHMTEMFHENIPSNLNFVNLSLNISRRSRGKRRNLKMRDHIFDYTGVAYFQTSMEIEEAIVYQARMRSFDSNGMKTFVNLLKASGMNASNAFLVTTRNDTITTNLGNASMPVEGDIDGTIVSVTSEDFTNRQYAYDYLKEIGGLIVAFTVIAIMIIGLITYKVKKRMMDRLATESNSNLNYQSDEDVESYDEKQLFAGSHSIYQIVEEESHDLSSQQSSRRSISLS